jgi:hypothetical protein
MPTPHDPDQSLALTRRAEALAARLPPSGTSFADDLHGFDTEFRALVDAVRQIDAQFAFDRDGRPAAIETIRAALPGVERELLEAVVEDHACELRAIQEALYQVLMIHRRG